MSATIHALTFGRLTMDSSGLVLFRRPGTRETIPFVGYLILGAGEPILVDTGASDVVDWAGWGMEFEKTPDMTVEAQLARFVCGIPRHARRRRTVFVRLRSHVRNLRRRLGAWVAG